MHDHNYDEHHIQAHVHLHAYTHRTMSCMYSMNMHLYTPIHTANGFCNSEVTMSGGLSYIWPEASSGTTVSIPCPSDSSVMVTRMCSGSDQWEEPNLGLCRSVSPLITCEAESVTLPGEAAIYSWPETPAGEVVNLTCVNSGELIFRLCAPNGEWGTFDDDICGALDDGLEMLLNQNVSETSGAM